MKWLYLIIAVIFEVIATSALKESNSFTKLVPSLFVIIGYSISFYFLSLTLKNLSIGITYAIWSGLGILLICLVGYFRYGQNLDFPAIIGILFIGIGILIIRFFSVSINL
ncbi:MAG: multidrug efflux SMR transporter [Bacteroidota bacterium]|jgi:small multidrug resistance pump|nr:QacE family quaternary ammonium compound efflux SMR transporter [Flammeovirgaceae bacterium]MEC8221731.1 multidrug efflux SMR transporter [Bacteroidota bacterium]|tara:strand:+ start:432 stop:761 length:330 start_codon:yes stop_codon:yes gene_type:complete